MRTKPGFTLTELLVAIAIMGLMFGLLVPLVDRSLGGNRIANDAEVFRSKLEEIRLLAGSTRNEDESSESRHSGALTYDEVGYYAIWLHKDDYNGGNNLNHYDVVRLSYPVNGTSAEIPCKPNDVQQQAWDKSGPCFVERIEMSKGVDLTCSVCERGNRNYFLAFSAPAGQFHEVSSPGTGQPFLERNWRDTGPVFELTFNGKKATITIDPYTAKTAVTYN
jgi:prepilin-type N-terminal cleavage/methylation domain-containing protein